MTDAKRALKKGGGVLGAFKEIGIILVGALVASTLLRMFLLQVFVIPSGSMKNTMLIGDRVAVQKVSGFQRGDIVVFKDDLGWLRSTTKPPQQWWQSGLTFVGLLPDESQNYLIKRVIGMLGDHISCCDSAGRLVVNGVALEESEYLFKDASGKQVQPSEMVFDIVVPQGKIFVMGDHRNASSDSRCHLDATYNGVAGASAFVSQSSVVGQAVATVFPFSRIGGHPRPATFAGVPAATGTAPASPVINGQPPPAC